MSSIQSESLSVVAKFAIRSGHCDRVPPLRQHRHLPTHLCSGLKPFRKRHHMQAGVGHYGVFSGRKWDGQIYPIVRNMIVANS